MARMDGAAFDTSLGFEGSHVLVTGSSGAIGSVVVRAFLSAGAFVTAFDITEAKDGFSHERLQSQRVDITDEVGLEQAMEKARGKFGVISTCIAVAGLDLSYLPHVSLVDMPLADWKRIMNVNVDGTFLTCRAWLRGLRDHATPETKNISAVIFGSEAGRFGVADCAPYATSKAAIQYGLVKSLARDAVDINPKCRINAVAPGPVDTAQFRKECEESEQLLWREAEATVALKRTVAPEAVARACLFLASDNYACSGLQVEKRIDHVQIVSVSLLVGVALYSSLGNVLVRIHGQIADCHWTKVATWSCFEGQQYLSHLNRPRNLDKRSEVLEREALEKCRACISKQKPRELREQFRLSEGEVH